MDTNERSETIICGGMIMNPEIPKSLYEKAVGKLVLEYAEDLRPDNRQGLP